MVKSSSVDLSPEDKCTIAISLMVGKTTNTKTSTDIGREWDISAKYVTTLESQALKSMINGFSDKPSLEAEEIPNYGEKVKAIFFSKTENALAPMSTKTASLALEKDPDKNTEPLTIEEFVDYIISWNDDETTSPKIFISKSNISKHTGVSLKKATEWSSNHKDMLEKHHAKHSLSPHNNVSAAMRELNWDEVLNVYSDEEND